MKLTKKIFVQSVNEIDELTPSKKLVHDTEMKEPFFPNIPELKKFTSSFELQSRNNVSLSPEVNKYENILNISPNKKKPFSKHPFISRKSPLYNKFGLEDNLQYIESYNTEPASAGFYSTSRSKFSQGTPIRIKESKLASLINFVNRTELQEQIDSRNLDNGIANNLNKQIKILKSITTSERKLGDNFTFYHKRNTNTQNSSTNNSRKNSLEKFPATSPKKEILINLNTQFSKLMDRNQCDDCEKEEFLSESKLDIDQFNTYIKTHKNFVSKNASTDELDNNQTPLNIFSNSPNLKITPKRFKKLDDFYIPKEKGKISEKNKDSSQFERKETNISTNLDKVVASSVLTPVNKLDLSSLEENKCFKFASLSTIEYPGRLSSLEKNQLFEPLPKGAAVINLQTLHSTGKFLKKGNSDHNLLTSENDCETVSNLKFDVRKINSTVNIPENLVDISNQLQNYDLNTKLQKIGSIKMRITIRPRSLTRPTYTSDKRPINSSINGRKDLGHRRELTTFTKLGTTAMNRFVDVISNSKQNGSNLSITEKNNNKQFDFRENRCQVYPNIAQIPEQENSLNLIFSRNEKSPHSYQIRSTTNTSFRKGRLRIGIQRENGNINSLSINSRLKQRNKAVIEFENLTNTNQSVNALIDTGDKNEVLWLEKKKYYGKILFYNHYYDIESVNTREMDKMRLEIQNLSVINWCVVFHNKY